VAASRRAAAGEYGLPPAYAHPSVSTPPALLRLQGSGALQTTRRATSSSVASPSHSTGRLGTTGRAPTRS
jgi:hypothetical protein